MGKLVFSNEKLADFARWLNLRNIHEIFETPKQLGIAEVELQLKAEQVIVNLFFTLGQAGHDRQVTAGRINPRVADPGVGADSATY